MLLGQPIRPWVPVLALALVLTSPGALAEQLAPLETERIASGHSGDGINKEYHPWGNVSVPANAKQVRLEVDWDVLGASQTDEIELAVCPSDCHHEDALAHTKATPPLTWTVELPALETLAWHAEAQGPAPQQTNLTGTVTFLGPSEETQIQQTSAPSAPPTPSSDLPSIATYPAIATGLLSALAGLAYALRRWLPGGLVGLFSRIPEDELLENETRQRIFDLVRTRPGIHFRGIARQLDLSLGQLEHHVTKLTRGDLLVEETTDGYSCYFAPGAVDDTVKRLATKLRTDTARAILEAVLERPGASLSAVAYNAGVSRSAATYHVGKLVDAGMVDKDRDGRSLSLEITDVGERVADQLRLG